MNTKPAIGGQDAVKVIAHLSRNYQQSALTAVRQGTKYVYVPASIADFDNIIKLLKTPTGIFRQNTAIVFDSTDHGETVYTSLQEAQAGVDTAGMSHQAFLEIDVNSRLVTDFIDRNGKSLVAELNIPIIQAPAPQPVIQKIIEKPIIHKIIQKPADHSDSVNRLIEKINTVEKIMDNYKNDSEDAQKANDTNEFFYKRVLEKINKIEGSLEEINRSTDSKIQTAQDIIKNKEWELEKLESTINTMKETIDKLNIEMSKPQKPKIIVKETEPKVIIKRIVARKNPVKKRKPARKRKKVPKGYKIVKFKAKIKPKPKKKRKPVKRTRKIKTKKVTKKKVIKRNSAKKNKQNRIKKQKTKKLPSDINQQEVTNLIVIKELQNLQKQHKNVTGTMFKNHLTPKMMSEQTFYKIVKQLFLSRRISRRKQGKDFIYKVLRF